MANVPVQSLIDHINTAIDIDPWAKEMAEELLKEQSKWISVKDGLPEKSGNVLVCVKLNYADGARYVQMCHYSAYKKQFGCFDTSESNGFPKFGVVTHWMPLPEPPKE